MTSSLSSSSTNMMISGAAWRFIASFIQKIISFGCNQILLQNTNAEILGIASILFELLLSTILFLSREGIRMAILRSSICKSKVEFQKIINLSWIPFFIVFFVIVGLLLLLLLHRNDYNRKDNINDLILYPSRQTNSIDIGVSILGCFGVLFESMGEPWYNLYQYQHQFKPRAQAEIIAVLIQNMSTVLLVVYFHWGVYGFALAQLIYGVTYFVVLCSYGGLVMRPQTTPKTTIYSSTDNTINSSDSKKDESMVLLVSCQWTDFLPGSVCSSSSSYGQVILTDSANKKSRKKATFCESEIIDIDTNIVSISIQTLKNALESFFSLSTLYSSIIITASSVLKHLLTQSDRIVLTFFYSAYQQGVFAFANNYGSLIARLVFTPLEDSSRVSISNTVTDIKTLLNENMSLWSSRSSSSTSKSSASMHTINTTYNAITSGSKIRKSRKKSSINEGLSTNQSTDNDHSIPAATTTTNDNKEKKVLVINKFKALWSDLYNTVKLLHFISIFGFLILLFGPFYIRVAVNIFVASRWRNEDVIYTICTYCAYIVVLGMNGITEAFVQATCAESEYVFINICYFISTLVYVAVVASLSVYAPGLGASGLVLASTASMTIRVIYSMWYIRSTFFSNCHDRLSMLALTSDRIGNQKKSEIKNPIEIPNSVTNITAAMIQDIMKSIEKKDPFFDFQPSSIIPTISTSVGIAALLYQSSTIYATSAQTWKDAFIHICMGGILFLCFLVYLYFNAPCELQQQIKSFVLRRTRSITIK